MTDFHIILRSLRLRLFSTIVTMSSVAVAVGLLMALIILRNSGEQAFARGTGNAQLLVSRDASPLESVLNGIFYANPPRNPLTMEKYDEIIESFPWAWSVPLQLGDSYQGLPVVATNSDFFREFQPVEGVSWSFQEGRRFARPYELVVGSEAALKTGLKMGDAIPLTHGYGSSREEGHVHDNHLFEVVGILEPTNSPHDRALFTDLAGSWVLHAEDRMAHGDHDHGHDHGHDHDHDHDHDHHHHHHHLEVSDLTPEDKLITGIYLSVPSRGGSAVSAILPQAFDQLRRDTSITVASPSNQVDRLFSIVGSVDRLFVAMGVVILISSGIGILLALWNSMEQRRRQIAIMRVLGCPKSRVFSLVVTESAVIGLVGALGGILVCWIGMMVTAEQLRIQLGIVINPALELMPVLVTILATVGLAALAGIAPAMRGYRTAVSRNLRPLS
ncbi:MAG: FtsX-like permease family protein [Planctomycetota bacterium]|nr:FtsX-like permease family protein [Planctomycetota bacterium]